MATRKPKQTDEAEKTVALPLGFKNAEGRGFKYSTALAKQAGKFRLVPVTDAAELEKALEVSGTAGK